MKKDILEQFDKQFGYDLMDNDGWSLDSINELKTFLLWIHSKTMDEALSGILVFPDPIFIKEKVKVPKELMDYLRKEFKEEILKELNQHQYIDFSSFNNDEEALDSDRSDRILTYGQSSGYNTAIRIIEKLK